MFLPSLTPVSACFVVVAIALVASPNTVLAQQAFQPISQEELKMTSEPLAPGAPAIILYRQVDRDDNRHTPHEDNYFRIKILTEEGRKYANIEIPFFKQNQEVVHIRARTIRPDGSIADFDGQVFEKSIVKSRGFKYLAKTLALPAVEVGGIIEYFYTVDMKENFIYDSHWILSQDLFTKKARFSLKRSLRAPRFSISAGAGRACSPALSRNRTPRTAFALYAWKPTTFPRSRPKISCLRKTN